MLQAIGGGAGFLFRGRILGGGRGEGNPQQQEEEKV